MQKNIDLIPTHHAALRTDILSLCGVAIHCTEAGEHSKASGEPARGAEHAVTGRHNIPIHKPQGVYNG